MPEKNKNNPVSIAEINKLALEIKNSGGDLKSGEKANELLGMLSQYAQFLLHPNGKLPVDGYERCEEIAQEACLRAIKKFDDFDPSRNDNYSNHFFYICRNARRIRQAHELAQKRTPADGRHVVTIHSQSGPYGNWALEIPGHEKTPPDHLIELEEIQKGEKKGILSDEIMDMALSKRSPLTKTQKLIFSRRYVDGMSYKEIAEETGKSHSAVTSHMHLANKALKKYLGPDGGLEI